MSRSKQSKPQQFEKLLALMVSGNPVTKEQVKSKLESSDFQVYRLSTYIWNLKMAGGVVRPVKDGRKVIAYQLVNTDEMKKYLASRKIESESVQEPVQESVQEPVVQKLEDLNATPEKTEEEPVEKPVQKSKSKAKPKKVKKEEVVEVLEVTEEE